MRRHKLRTRAAPFREWPWHQRAIERLYRWTHGGQMRTLARLPLTCDRMPGDAWLFQFRGACYFYPDRDCPGWLPGQRCARIGETIPDE